MSKTGYSSTQIRLHWLLAVMVLVQFIFHDGVHNLGRLIQRGEEPSILDVIWGQSHVVLGLLIFVMAAVRLSVRLKQKVPPPPQAENAVLKIIAKLTHFMLYTILLVMPVSGSVAWFGHVELAAKGHEFGKGLLLAFLFLHVVGALYQQFVLKTDVLKRMVKPENNF